MAKNLLRHASLCSLLAVVLAAPAQGAAETVTSTPVRLAIGPFFASSTDTRLASLSGAIPDLLAAELSDEMRFVLVERDQVSKVCRELDLKASGLVRQSDVSKLGQLLACDWLVSGSLVPTDSGTAVWTKVIDIRNGVVLDMGVENLQGVDPSGITGSIAEFVRRAKPGGQGSEFIAVGPIMNLAPGLPANNIDWPKRISTGIEHHFQKAGRKTVEIAAVMPIFAERMLEEAGLTGQAERRIRLQAAFWFVDGACEPKLGSPNVLRLQLRLQRVGGEEQLLTFTTPMNADVEAIVAKRLQDAMASEPAKTTTDSDRAETAFLKKRTDEQIEARYPFETEHRSSNIGLDGFIERQRERDQRIENLASIVANYRRLLLRDPEDKKAKYMLGKALLFDPNPDRREEGKQLIYEVAGRKRETVAMIAQTEAQRQQLREEIELVPSIDLAALERAYGANPSDVEAKYNLGALLVHSNDGPTQDRGANLLREVMAVDKGSFAERAQKICPKPGTRTVTF